MPNIMDLPELRTGAPDVVAADAALDAALPPEVPDAPTPNAGEAAPAPAPTPSAEPVKRGPGRPPADKWSDRKLSKASRAELRARVKDLQERTAAAPPADVAASSGSIETPPPAPMDPAELVAPLGLTFSTLGTLAASVYGAHWKLTDDEARALGMAWAPLAVRYASHAGAALPWGLALLTTAGVLAPKLAAHAEAQRLAGASPAETDTTPPLRGPDA